MSTELNEAAVQQFKQEEKLAVNGFPALSESLNTLAKVGGYDFLEGIVDGADNLNPVRKAKKNIFLTDGNKKEQRKELKKKIEMWTALLNEHNSVAEMVDKAVERADTAEKLLKGNLKKVLNHTKQLEQSYRSIHLFYKNTESPKLKNVVLMNAPMSKLTDLDEPRFIEFVAAELKNKYDRLDLRENYSMLVIPGYLKSNTIVDKWAKMAYNNKVMLVTDFENIETPDDVLDMFTDANLTSGDPHKANVVMTCNYIVGRGKKTEVGEEEDVYVPGSAALAGKMYCTKLSQPVAGKTYGSIDEVDTVRFDQLKGDISELENVGLVPLVGSWGRVMPFSAKTLFTGDNIGMQTYSVVRVFDFIAKVLSDFLNRRAFELWNVKMEKNLRSQIVKFLDGIQGPDKLIEKFQIIRFERDEDQKDHIFLDIHITPFFPAKSFLVKLDGYKGDDGEEWKAQFKQQ
ncbi:type VI secretion system contractile sheath protein TssC [Danxiaibacter flavus]|uniref:Type VI secretion system contractile sheath protein TssC n=1 Tax=Danxiaibacter flavus TaxID=3049108 RepID=A0ABV3ZGC5_9BACT|nr:type VI secretion system contractile sheath protein TssC [Chitinophagaceae bacterium DXS]